MFWNGYRISQVRAAINRFEKAESSRSQHTCVISRRYDSTSGSGTDRSIFIS